MYPENVYNEQELLRRIAGDDGNAFRIIFDAYKNRLLGLVFKMTKSAVTSEEILQEVFLTIWKNRADLPAVERPDQYFLAIARNKTIDYLRKVSKEQLLLDELWVNIQAFEDTTTDLMDMQDSNQLLEQALSRLSLQKQEIFRLSRQQGLSHEQIAIQTGLSKSRVKNILVETLKHLKTHFLRHSPFIGFLFWVGIK